MLKEDYCSFEVAKLLKEMGFNEKCRGGYHSEFDDNDRPIVMLEEWMAQPYNNDFVDEGFLCSAPTHQMAMKWLREVHNLHIDIDPSEGDWNPTVITLEDWSCVVKFGDNIPIQDTYEEAVEAALKYALENLI